MTYSNYQTSQTLYLTGCNKCTTNYERQREIFVCFAWVAKHKFLVYDNVILYPQPMCHTFEMISIIIYIIATIIRQQISYAYFLWKCCQVMHIRMKWILNCMIIYFIWFVLHIIPSFESLNSFKLFSLQILGSWEYPQIFWRQCTSYRKYRKYTSWKEMWFD